MRIKRSFVFFAIIILVFLLFTSLHYKKIEDVLLEICQSNAHSIALKCTEDAIAECTDGITYSSIVSIEKTNEGKIVAITSNVDILNKLSNKIISKLEENLAENSTSKISVPLGTILGSNAFGGYGIKLKIKTLPVSDATIKYTSYFDSVGINQTRHRIILDITAKVKVIAPLVTTVDEYTKEVVLAETVLVGDIPICVMGDGSY